MSFTSTPVSRGRTSAARGIPLVLVLLLLIQPLGAESIAAGVGEQAASAPLSLEVVSNRADLISGGDALVEVALPAGTDVGVLAVDVDGRDVTDAFASGPDGSVIGLLTDLALGPNEVTARLPDGSGARITITNHPNGGPVFSGPQIQPWSCNDGALDDACNRPVTYEYLYWSTSSTGQTGALASQGVPVPGEFADWRPYDPDNPQSDVATTTTDEGHTVPFIVRVETGSQDRGEYKIAVLYDPDLPFEPHAPQEQWNQKLLITHGADCGTAYREGTAPDVLNHRALGEGFATMSTALNNTGHNCNMVVQAESMMMAKERIIEQYGDIRYTIGTGGSGGALVQQWVANGYPGIYDGITMVGSYPDAYTIMNEVDDCNLLLRYFDNVAGWGTNVWTEAQQAAVMGHISTSVCRSWAQAFGYPHLFRPGSGSCSGVSGSEKYHPTDNPDGVRCTLWDYGRNILGLRPDGFANRPLDNVGVQYGLKALEAGLITTAQFVDLNARVGAHDIDYNWQPERIAADRDALVNTYRSGLANQANNMDRVAIIDQRGADPEIHHHYRTWSMRARLGRANGHHDNQTIWYGLEPLFGDTQLDMFGVMDEWLTAVEADERLVPLEDKIVDNRPESARDRCTNGAGTDIPASACVIPYDETPRIVAGQDLTDDVFKCQLRPLLRSDYYPLSFSDADWAELEAAFPSGVCDYRQPGVGQQPTVAWQTYDGGPGGRPLGPPPTAEPLS